MKFKLSVSKIIGVLLLIFAVSLLVLGKDMYLEAYDLWNLGEPSQMYYVESTIENIDLENNFLTVSTKKPEILDVKLSILDKYRLEDYLIGNTVNLICDSDKNVICLYSYYLDIFKISTVLLGVSLILVLFSFISFFVGVSDLEEDYYDEEDILDEEEYDENEINSESVSIEYVNSSNNISLNNKGEVYD